MKNVLTLLVFLGMSLVGANAQDGVKFREGSFQEALEVAREQKKMLFVDVYTSWCGPCRWMSEEVLQTSEAAAFFDKHFVCFKIDAEKGEGVAFAEKYDVRAYPTFLMFQPDGTLQHKVVGADTLHLFIPRVECGLHKKTSWAYLMDKYQSGKLGKKEIPAALQVFQDAGMKEEVKVLSDSLFGLLSDKERLDLRYRIMYDLVGYDDLFTERFRFLVEHRQQIGKGDYAEPGAKVIRYVIENHLNNNTIGMISKRGNIWNLGEDNEMPYMRSLLERCDLPERDFLLTWCDVAQASYNEDAEGMKEGIQKIAAFPESLEYKNGFLMGLGRLRPEDQQDEVKALEKLWD